MEIYEGDKIMEILLGKNVDVKKSFQTDFPKNLACDCSGEMVPIVQVCDDEGVISKYKPKKAKLWPHDSMILVTYMCKNCLTVKTVWNQA